MKSVVPVWDLSLVLSYLAEDPFEPVERAGLLHWTLKTTFLLAVTSAARVGELQALDSNPNLCVISGDKASLRLNPAFMPKSCNVAYINRSISLQAFYPDPVNKEQEALHMLCPVRALKPMLFDRIVSC